MFTSNQILQISGSLSNILELELAIDFALKFSEYSSKKIVYQITDDGKYCIGWADENIPDGWHAYPFDFDIELVSIMIKQHLQSFFAVKKDFWDDYGKGFFMNCISDYMSDGTQGIKEPSHGIVYFTAYTCYYAE